MHKHPDPKRRRRKTRWESSRHYLDRRRTNKKSTSPPRRKTAHMTRRPQTLLLPQRFPEGMLPSCPRQGIGAQADRESTAPRWRRDSRACTCNALESKGWRQAWSHLFVYERKRRQTWWCRAWLWSACNYAGTRTNIQRHIPEGRTGDTLTHTRTKMPEFAGAARPARHAIVAPITNAFFGNHGLGRRTRVGGTLESEVRRHRTKKTRLARKTGRA